MALGKLDIQREIVDITDGYFRVSDVGMVLDSLRDLAVEQLEAGEDFIIPGIVKITWKYRSPKKKGEKYRKGQKYKSFGGEIVTAEADSKPVSEQILLAAVPAGGAKGVSGMKPGRSPEAQSSFGKTKTAKAIRARQA